MSPSFDWRVIAEHRTLYILANQSGDEIEAELPGHLIHAISQGAPKPIVGDWVACENQAFGRALIQEIAPRHGILRRQTGGSSDHDQLVGANIDGALLVQGLGFDFNLHRLERYMALCHDAAIGPRVVLTRADQHSPESVVRAIGQIHARHPDIVVFGIGNPTGSGIAELLQHLESGKTYCLLGSSGAGKSTLLNNLCGNVSMRTGATSAHTGKGKHTTTHRQLITLPCGAIIMDNPGMREVGVGGASSGIGDTFAPINELAEQCRFRDCSHSHESGCAVRNAVAMGELDADILSHWHKLMRESAHYDESALERRRRERSFGKMLKDYQKGRYR